jgi:hypothetical protein
MGELKAMNLTFNSLGNMDHLWGSRSAMMRWMCQRNDNSL